MSDPAVSISLTKVLCSRGGRLPRSLLPTFLNLSPEQIEEILQDGPERFPQAGEMVLARSPVRTCDKYLENIQEEECDKLHLCREYLRGKCWASIRPRCSFSHDIFSDQNQKVMKTNEISGLNEEEIKVLLLQNDNQLLPGVCEKYLGESCDLGEDCSRLHICGSFIRGQCGGGDCRRSHDLLEFGSDLLLSRCHFPELSIKNFQALCAVKHIERLQSLTVKEEETPTALSGPRKRKNSADVSENEGHGRRQDTTDSSSEKGPGGRPISASAESHRRLWRTTDDEKPVKVFIVPDLSSPGAAHPLTSPEVAHPLTSPEVAHPLTTPEVAHPLTSPEAAHLLTSPEAAHPLTSPEVAHPLTSPEGAHPLTSAEVAHPLTSPEVAHPLTSPEVAHPLTSPEVAHLLTSPEGAHLLTSPEVAHLLTSPEVAHLLTSSEVAHLLTSPVVAHLLTSPEVALLLTATEVAHLLTSPEVANPLTSPEVANPLTSPDVANPLTSPEVANPLTSPEVANPLTSPEVAHPLTSPEVSHPLTSREVANPLTSPEVANPLTSPEVANPLTSPDVANPLTSPDVANPLTSPDVANPLTSPEVANPLTSPDVANPLTSPDVANPLTSPDVAHPLTVSSVMDYHNYSISLAETSPDVSSAPHKNPGKVPEICLSNLWKYCKLEGRCPDMHYYLPYRWQIYKGTGWEDIPNMEAIEKCYCNPSADRAQLIDFVTMRSSVHPVRRLSTVSFVVKPPDYVLTTEWLWYWKNEKGAWTQYGHLNVKKVSATTSSSDLENAYLTDPSAVLPFIAGKHQYEMNFQEMKQRNIKFGTERDVRRRPKYLSFEDVKLLRGSTKSSAPQRPLESEAVIPLRTAPPPLKTDIYPRTWNTSALPEIGCKKVLVSERSSEFMDIVSIFAKTVNGHVVKKLWRLQNPFLWQVFQQQKKQMKKLNKGRDVKEMRLFHGTKNKHVEAICNQNFDWRLCGTHGTRYGQGSYFARDASYSHTYSVPMFSGTRMMFVARVLVGEYMEGTSEMKRPPLKPGSSSHYYDSSVDNITDPSMFVVFEKHQIYPEYLLEYEEQK